MSFLIEDDGQGESNPFINSDNDEESYYDSKNMALFEVRQNLSFFRYTLNEG